MRSSSVVFLFLLAVAMTSCRPSLANAIESGAGSSITATLGRELRKLVARADSMFRSSLLSAGSGWHAASGSGVAEAKNLRAVEAARRQRPRGKSSAGGGGARCVTAAACRKRRVICGKRCFNNGAASRALSSSVNHVAKCVVKCRKCVPTC